MNINELINSVPKSKKVIEVSWKKYYQSILYLSKLIKKSKKKFDAIYGIPRAGLITAVCFSYLLDLPVITDIKKVTLKTLIVDEIIETGATFRNLKLKEPIENYTTVALIKYKENPFIPTYWGWLTDRWVVFPYEIKNDKPKK